MARRKLLSVAGLLGTQINIVLIDAVSNFVTTRNQLVMSPLKLDLNVWKHVDFVMKVTSLLVPLLHQNARMIQTTRSQ